MRGQSVKKCLQPSLLVAVRQPTFDMALTAVHFDIAKLQETTVLK